MTDPDFNLSDGFSLGVINVYPSRNLISTGEGETHLEPKVMEVLCLLAENSGQVVSRSDLIDEIWEVEFGADESLTRAISLLRKALQNGDESEGVIETIPKKGYMLTLPVYGMEDTGTAPSPGNLNPNVKGQHKLKPRYLVLAAFALIAAVGIAVWQIWYQPAEPELPLTAFFGITADPDDEIASAIAQEATEEIFTGMDGMGHRTVAKGQIQKVPSEEQLARAREFGAHFSLGGRVRRDETGYVISIQIDDVRDQKTIWEAATRSSAEDRSDLPVLAADRALRAGRCFNQFMPLQPTAPTQTKRAVSDLCTDNARATYAQYVTRARAVAALLPENPDIHARLAINLLGPRALADTAQARERRKEARQVATYALDLDPDNGTARNVLTKLAFFNGASLAEVETEFAAAAKVDPRTNFPNGHYAEFLQRVGRPSQALRYMQAATQLNPANRGKRTQYGRSLFYAGSPIEAVRWLEEQNRRDQIGSAWYSLVQISYLEDTGDLDWAIGLKPDGLNADVARCLELIVTAETNDRAIEMTEQCRQRKLTDTWANILTGVKIGDLDYAFASVHEQFTPITILQTGYGFDIAWLYTPKFRPMRADRRFLPLMKRLGLFNYWVTSNTHPEFCDAAEDRDSEICTAIRKAQAEGN